VVPALLLCEEGLVLQRVAQLDPADRLGGPVMVGRRGGRPCRTRGSRG
jgi:hypothetical protein